MDYTIYILAEGQSSRMGMDKGLVILKGKEMIAHCIDNLAPLQKEIVLVTSNPAYEKFGLRMISDAIKNQGPAQGVLTALTDSKTEKNLIISCDMPLVNILMFNSIFYPPLSPPKEGNMATPIICFEKDYLFPFPGVYSKSILPKWKKEIENGKNKMQSLIKQFSYKTLPIEHPELFLNVNTAAELAQAEKLL